MAAKDDLGRAGEERAARHLQSLGYAIVDRNWRCRAGEIDIVATSARDLLVVEVKTRRGEGFGHPFESIDAVKRARLWRLAMAWIADHRETVQGRRLRFAAVGVVGPDPATADIDLLLDLDLR
ncbi:YraN family protein [Planococcus sp. APC 4015]|nr:YraN family protein [Planococcus sp. APC 4015]